MSDKEIFSNKLKDAELKLGYNHPEMSILLGFPLASYIKWYSGKVLPSVKRQEIVLAKIKSKLG